MPGPEFSELRGEGRKLELSRLPIFEFFSLSRELRDLQAISAKMAIRRRVGGIWMPSLDGDHSIRVGRAGEHISFE